MPLYFYKAKNFKGEYVSGTTEEKSRKDLAKSLRKDGYILISAEKESSKRKLNFSIPFLNKVSLVEKMVFTRNLKVLISAGVSLPRAMKILSKQTKNKKFKKAILGVGEKVTKGTSFSQALGEYPGVFSELFCNMIKAGEESGTLEGILESLTEQMERTHELKQKVKGALIYPSVIVFTMALIGVLMIVVVVPKLAETFEELNMELPLTTRAVVNTGTFLASYWYLFLLGIIVLVVLLKMAVKTKRGKEICDGFFLKIPIISNIIKKANSAHMTGTLSSLISSGIPITKSLHIVAKTSSNIYYKKALLEASQKMKKGLKLAEGLKKYEKIFPMLVVQMIEIGEETGETSSILKKLSEFYQEEVANATKNLSSIIEPFLMLLIGGAVGFFAISMLQPIYGMLGSI